jgi:hypothetical protein
MSSFITLEEAILMTSTYQKLSEVLLEPAYRNKDVLFYSESFEAAQVSEILQREGCIGLRVYLGMDPEQKIHAILVGTDEKGEDILPPLGSGELGYILDKHDNRCPPDCLTSRSPLYQG